MQLFRHVVLLSVITLASAAIDLSLMSVDNVIAAYKNNEFTAVQLTTAYIARINEVNSVFHSVLEINPDALTVAAALDAETKAGISRGKMHGVPILIKDNIATFDKMNNTGGSFALLGATVPEDSTLAAKLRASGRTICCWLSFRSI
jgi:amidase